MRKTGSNTSIQHLLWGDPRQSAYPDPYRGRFEDVNSKKKESQNRKNQMAIVIAVILAAILIVTLMVFVITRSSEHQQKLSADSVNPLIAEMNQSMEVFEESSKTVDLAYEMGFSESVFNPLLESSNELGTLVAGTYQSFSDFISETIDEDQNILYIVRESSAIVPSADTEKRFYVALSDIKEMREKVVEEQVALEEKIDDFELNEVEIIDPFE